MLGKICTEHSQIMSIDCSLKCLLSTAAIQYSDGNHGDIQPLPPNGRIMLTSPILRLLASILDCRIQLSVQKEILRNDAGTARSTWQGGSAATRTPGVQTRLREARSRVHCGLECGGCSAGRSESGCSCIDPRSPFLRRSHSREHRRGFRRPDTHSSRRCAAPSARPSARR